MRGGRNTVNRKERYREGERKRDAETRLWAVCHAEALSLAQMAAGHTAKRLNAHQMEVH